MPDINTTVPLKKRKIYIVLGLFLGLLGIHNIYAGRYKTAIIQALVTLSTFWAGIALIAVYIWVIFEIFMVSHDGNRNLMIENSSALRIIVGVLMVWPGICIMLLAAWIIPALWYDSHPETGENFAKVNWLPPSAKNVSYYKSYSWTAFEFDINEVDFRQWATLWMLKEIDKEQTICRYSYLNFLKEKQSAKTENDWIAYENAKKIHLAIVSKGLYDSKIYHNGGGYNVVFDRDKQRAYFQSNPR